MDVKELLKMKPAEIKRAAEQMAKQTGNRVKATTLYKKMIKERNQYFKKLLNGELKGIIEETKKLASRKQELAKLVKSLQKDLKQVSNDITKLKAQLNKSSLSSAEKKALKQQLKQLEAKRDKLVAELKSAKNALGIIEKAYKDAIAKQKQLIKSVEQADSIIGRVASVKEKIQTILKNNKYAKIAAGLVSALAVASVAYKLAKKQEQTAESTLMDIQTDIALVESELLFSEAGFILESEFDYEDFDFELEF